MKSVSLPVYISIALTFSVPYGGGYVCFLGGMEWVWAIRYLGSPRTRTVEPQMVKGGRYICGHATEVETGVVDLSANSSPSQATEKDKESTTHFERYATNCMISYVASSLLIIFGRPPCVDGDGWTDGWKDIS